MLRRVGFQRHGFNFCHGLIAHESCGLDKAAPSIFGYATDATRLVERSPKLLLRLRVS
jgi:hypothetical protein